MNRAKQLSTIFQFKWHFISLCVASQTTHILARFTRYMFITMIFSRYNFKILYTVITLYSVNMMNSFVFIKLSSYLLFHYHSMLICPLIFTCPNSNITFFITSLSSTPICRFSSTFSNIFFNSINKWKSTIRANTTAIFPLTFFIIKKRFITINANIFYFRHIHTISLLGTSTI